MINNWRVRGNEKRYEGYHRMYRRCDFRNTKIVLKYYYNIKEKILVKKRISLSQQ